MYTVPFSMLTKESASKDLVCAEEAWGGGLELGCFDGGSGSTVGWTSFVWFVGVQMFVLEVPSIHWYNIIQCVRKSFQGVIRWEGSGIKYQGSWWVFCYSLILPCGVGNGKYTLKTM